MTAAIVSAVWFALNVGFVLGAWYVAAKHDEGNLSELQQKQRGE
jgi:hypothetical protein